LLAGGGTGGHLYPALNLADALRRAEPEVRLFFLGAQRGLEARVLPDSRWPYRLLPLQPLYRSQPWRNWRLLSTAPDVVRGVGRTFREFRPHLVVGTGGYVSGPVVLWGRLRGSRTAIQEQNAQPGLVTRLLASKVDQVHLGYPEARLHLKIGERTSVHEHGNPIRPPGGQTPEAFDWPAGPVVLVTGGSQGARGLNLRLLEDLEAVVDEGDAVGPAAGAASGPSAREGPGVPPRAAAPASSESMWPRDLSLVWVTGPAHAAEIQARVSRLPWKDRIRVVPFIVDLGPQLPRVSLAVCRAGAMFVSELTAAGVPAIIVPFPAAAGGHQTANAKALVDAGAALMREESALRHGELWELVTGLMRDEPRRRSMAEACAARGAPDAADRIAADLLRLLGASGGSNDDPPR
jgi:UDP-N-acetylglucosamine--N-acetylmuramyl-(pentapeptide) pyrophosphoryl-undecaprenol N-acetylglucosamine transferase